ncbi:MULTISPECIES: hypothetical protein [Streptomyces]|uniref:Uncharacterized protein n=2 Tax=Streptomyces TaxID=1883 RepID=A0A100Y091_9ACTN|nr:MULTISPECIES: hypothetical protein [Streptomyces]KUH35309.1 hypothetical protein ATE80_29930 [Streptomyces kanasensis]UUS34027.1 hypothetical protein NRO40_26500 [Streptomyces changanensis]
MNQRQPQTHTTAAAELRAEIEKIVAYIRREYENHSEDEPYYPILMQGGPAEAHQHLGYLHGRAMALLDHDIKGAIKQRRLLLERARRLGYRDDSSKTFPPADTAETSSRKRPAPREVHFPPVANGIDYLYSVVEHLTVQPEPQPRNLKYAVLHLYAATEVLLKARLGKEHRTLIWAEPQKATSSSQQARSCGAEEALDRLRDVLDIEVDAESRQAIGKLGKTRNQLQHDGLTQAAPAIEAQAAEVLDFLLAFIHQHLERDVDADLGRQLEVIKEKVGEIKTYVRKRTERLSRTLPPGATVQCPDCDRWTLVVGSDASVTCHFCDFTEDAERAALRYAETILGLSKYLSVSQGEEEPVRPCAGCPDIAMVAGAVTLDEHRAAAVTSVHKREAKEPDEGGGSLFAPAQTYDVQPIRYLCFSCASAFSSAELDTCSYCGSPLQRGRTRCVPGVRARNLPLFLIRPRP